MGLDVDRVRARYPALADGYAYLDGAAGTQLPDSVIDAMAGAWRAGLGNGGGAFPASLRSATITAECRRAVADLTGVLGLRDSGGAVRAGLVHYNDRSDVDRLLAAVAELDG